MSGDTDLDENANMQKRAFAQILKENKRRAERKKNVVLQSRVTTSYSTAFELADERGASNLLTALPIEEHGLCMSKAVFKDVLCLR